MATIRIVSVPAGQAPLRIRRKWVGIEMQAIPAPTGMATAGVRTPTECNGHTNHGDFMVNTRDAVGVLKAAGQHEAAQYWETLRQGGISELIFRGDCLTVIDGVATAVENNPGLTPTAPRDDTTTG